MLCKIVINKFYQKIIKFVSKWQVFRICKIFI